VVHVDVVERLDDPHNVIPTPRRAHRKLRLDPTGLGGIFRNQEAAVDELAECRIHPFEHYFGIDSTTTTFLDHDRHDGARHSEALDNPCGAGIDQLRASATGHAGQHDVLRSAAEANPITVVHVGQR
jgi:hypothetical protein